MSSRARLLDPVSLDLLQFGHGEAFDASRVSKFLNLQKLDVSRLAGVPVRLVRYGAEMPGPVRECLEGVAGVVRMVAQAFDGDSRKTKAWFNATNPMLGDISPIDMIRLGRLERLRRFVLGAMT